MNKFDLNVRADKEVVRAVAKLQFQDDFKIYSSYLQGELDALRKQTDTATGDLLKWFQGRAQMLQMLVDLPEMCRDIIKKSN